MHFKKKISIIRMRPTPHAAVKRETDSPSVWKRSLALTKAPPAPGPHRRGPEPAPAHGLPVEAGRVLGQWLSGVGAQNLKE